MSIKYQLSFLPLFVYWFEINYDLNSVNKTESRNVFLHKS